MNPAHDHPATDWLALRRQASKPATDLRRATQTGESAIDVTTVSRREYSPACVHAERQPQTLLGAMLALGESAVVKFVPTQTPPPNERLSQAEFARLASDNNQGLLAILKRRPRIAARLLTFAAEAVALVPNPSVEILQAAIDLFSHEKAYVREGVVYGLTPHRENRAVSKALGEVAENDADEDVRSVAEEVLDD